MGKAFFIRVLPMMANFFAMGAHAQSEPIMVRAFDKVIVSPHIQVTMKEGNEASVVIENAKVPFDKINTEVVGKTLRIYLDGHE